MAQGKKEEAEAVKAEVAQISKRLTELEPLEKEYQDKVLEDMMKIPNIIDPSVRSERMIPSTWRTRSLVSLLFLISRFLIIQISWRDLTE